MKPPRFLSRRAAPAIAEPIEAAKAAAAPERDTVPYPLLQGLGQTNGRRLVYRPTLRNLRHFSTTPFARRAINAIKKPVSAFDWEIGALPGAAMSRELERQIRVASDCFAHPNSDDSLRTLIEKVVDDVLVGAGAIELVTTSDAARPLWMFPIDGLSIQVYPNWSGNPDEARYAQVVGNGASVLGSGSVINLRNDELSYILTNQRTCTPFGLAPLEVAFDTISRLLGVEEFAGNVATNARPSIGLDLGDEASPEAIASFRTYWRNEVEGQGQMPIYGIKSDGGKGDKSRGLSVQRFYPEGDSALYLKYQEFLIRTIATAFDLSPQNLGVERDVNRSNGEVGEDRDRDHAIKPMAALLASHFTRDVLHGKLGFYQLEFRFKGMDPEDEVSLQKVLAGHYATNSITPNEIRAKIGLPRFNSPWGDLLYVDTEIAKQAARGGDVIDPDLDPYVSREGGKTEPAPKPQRDKPKKV